MSSVFDDTDLLLARVKNDPELRKMIEALRLQRFSATPAEFESLLVLAMGNALCVGARLSVTELSERTR